MNHIAATLDRLHIIAAHYKQPALLTSFGKDSIVLIHLMLKAGFRWPVLIQETPFNRHKWAFGHGVAAAWDLTLHQLAPHSVVLQRTGDHEIEAVWRVEIGPGELMGFQRQIQHTPDPGPDCLCGLRDILGTPTASSPFRWDALISGQRSADINRRYGKMPLAAQLLNHGGHAADVVFALRDWSDQEIWDYTEANDLPINTDRYEKTPQGWQEREDKTHSNDWLPACMRCLDRSGPEIVHCPRTNMEMTSVAAIAPYVDYQLPYLAQPSTTQ